MHTTQGDTHTPPLTPLAQTPTSQSATGQVYVDVMDGLNGTADVPIHSNTTTKSQPDPQPPPPRLQPLESKPNRVSNNTDTTAATTATTVAPNSKRALPKPQPKPKPKPLLRRSSGSGSALDTHEDGVTKPTTAASTGRRRSVSSIGLIRRASTSALPTTDSHVTATRRGSQNKSHRRLSVSRGKTAPVPKLRKSVSMSQLMSSASPSLSAKSWIAIDGRTGNILAKSSDVLGKLSENRPLAMASLTKIMTLLVVLEYATKSPKVLKEVVTVSKRAAKTIGTTARLRTGDKVCVWDLCFGLMHPSGNDAGVALAEHVGKYLCKDMKTPRGTSYLPQLKAQTSTTSLLDSVKTTAAMNYNAFILRMNQLAFDLGLRLTHFHNPHGLDQYGHVSTAVEMAMLTRYAMTFPKVKSIVSVKDYTAKISRLYESSSSKAKSLQSQSAAKAPTEATAATQLDGDTSAEQLRVTVSKSRSNVETEEESQERETAAVADTIGSDINPTVEAPAVTVDAEHQTNALKYRYLPAQLIWKNNTLISDLQHQDGCKSGGTPRAGYCLATSMSHAGTHIIAVTLGSPTKSERAEDTRALVRWSARIVNGPIPGKGAIPEIGSTVSVSSTQPPPSPSPSPSTSLTPSIAANANTTPPLPDANTAESSRPLPPVTSSTSNGNAETDPMPQREDISTVMRGPTIVGAPPT
eukprot:GFYU01023814.1.p1 GENE.GFYU01023814.1~~GFYU01023814.1.p1  ORF type:complete len:694 (-),score=142.73 GFYU01023814.1:33-2114(-)